MVECAWAAFGAAFGPAIILSLFWKRFTYTGAVSGIIAGFLMDALWYCCFSGSVESLCICNTGLYEIIPGFVVSMVVAIIVSLVDKAPSKEVMTLFEEAKKKTE